jgi:hypothetical protein
MAVVPIGIVTVTSSVRGPLGGAVTLMAFSLATAKRVTVLCPNRTTSAPAKPEPWIVSFVPPAIGPYGGFTLENYRRRAIGEPGPWQ